MSGLAFFLIQEIPLAQPRDGEAESRVQRNKNCSCNLDSNRNVAKAAKVGCQGNAPLLAQRCPR